MVIEMERQRILTLPKPIPSGTVVVPEEVDGVKVWVFLRGRLLRPGETLTASETSEAVVLPRIAGG